MSIGYGLVFTVLAAFAAFVAALASGWQLLPFRIVGVAAAISLLLIAVAYSRAGPRLLLKKPTGRRFVWAWFVHWPFFSLTAFSYRLLLLGSQKTPYVAVTPSVFLGRRLTTQEAKQVVAAGCVAVLDLAAELPEARPLREVANYRSLPVLDATAMTLDQLRDAVEWVTKHAATGSVYVHCALGHGRSATVVAAYLLACGLAASAKDAVKQLRELRPGVRLNRAQRKVLNSFAEEVTKPLSPGWACAGSQG